MNKDKRIVSYSPKKQKTDSEVQILSFRERRCAFSLGFRPFGLLVLDGARSKVVLLARAMRGHRFGGVPTTPRGRDLFLLVLFFG